MKILWVTNVPINHHKEMLGVGTAQSGGWMEASYLAVENTLEITLGVATVCNNVDFLKSTKGRHTFYLLPLKGDNNKYDHKNQQNQAEWLKVINDFKPDIIHIWGTENPYGLCALKVAENIPSVIYVQGLMHEIYKHYLDGIDISSQIKNLSFHDIIRNNFSWLNRKFYKQSIAIEHEMLTLSNNVIVENDWCANHCSILSQGVNVFRSYLPVNKCFEDYSWSLDKKVAHTIFTVAGGYPIKGLHVLLHAFYHVLKEYPESKLRIPGDFSYLTVPWYSISSYGRYINRILNELNLRDNVIFLGKLSQNEMAKEMECANVFVMPSNIENHSSSLIEAMLVGVPTISAYVGGVSYYYRDGINGIFYRHDDVESLAMNIINIFNSDDFAYRLSERSKFDTKEMRLSIDISKDFVTTYKSIMK